MEGRTPGCMPAGRGRAGRKRSTGKRAGLRTALGGVSKTSLKRLARRAGVARISSGCFDPEVGILKALHDFLHRAFGKIVPLVTHARRLTVIRNDVAYALKQMGITMYMEGCDWTYGFYTRDYVRRRIVRPVPQHLLERAAARRAKSEVACAGGSAWSSSVAAAAAASCKEQEEDMVVAGAEVTAGCGEEEEKDQQQMVPTAASAARCAVQARYAFHAAVGEQEEGTGADGAGAMDAEQAAEGKNQEAQLLSPAMQRPALAAPTCGKVGPGKPGSAAAAEGERRLSDVPTPAGFMCKARQLEVLAWMSDLMHGPLQEDGRISRRDLKTVMLARHSVMAAEVQDLLFAKELDGTFMLEGDSIYLCT